MGNFSKNEILVASSDREMSQSIVAVLEQLGADATCASTVEQCREILEKEDVGLIFCDRRFSDGDYRDLMSLVPLDQGEGGTRVVLTTPFISPGEYQEAKRWGVFEIIASPSHSMAVEWMVIQKERDDLEREDTRASRLS